MSYYYQGKEIVLVPNQQYTTHWNFYWEEGGQKTIRSGQPGIDLHSSPISVTPEAEETTEILDTSVSLKINDASFTDIRRSFPGIGRIAAKAIADNKPEGGYQDFEQLLELNKSKVSNINWEEVKKRLVF